MGICKSKIQPLEKTIEEKKTKLNALMNQTMQGTGITDEILDLSHELDILINDYYYKVGKGKV